MNNTQKDYDELLKDFKLLATMYKETKAKLNKSEFMCDRLVNACQDKERIITVLMSRPNKISINQVIQVNDVSNTDKYIPTCIKLVEWV